MAAHLAGAIAAQTTLPVIGVPLAAKEGLGGSGCPVEHGPDAFWGSGSDGRHRQGGREKRRCFGGPDFGVIG